VNFPKSFIFTNMWTRRSRKNLIESYWGPLAQPIVGEKKDDLVWNEKKMDLVRLDIPHNCKEGGGGRGKERWKEGWFFCGGKRTLDHNPR